MESSRKKRKGENGSSESKKGGGKKSSKKGSSSSDEDQSNDIYEVEKILDKRTKGGKTQYLIQWRGYSDNSWEDESDIFCSDLIEEFEDHYKKNGSSSKSAKSPESSKTKSKAKTIVVDSDSDSEELKDEESSSESEKDDDFKMVTPSGASPSSRETRSKKPSSNQSSPSTRSSTKKAKKVESDDEEIKDEEIKDSSSDSDSSSSSNSEVETDMDSEEDSDLSDDGKPKRKKKDKCAICREGKDLARCNKCRKNFHPKCAGERSKKVKGPWQCPTCAEICLFCNKETSSEKGMNKLRKCPQCSSRYHDKCQKRELDPIRDDITEDELDEDCCADCLFTQARGSVEKIFKSRKLEDGTEEYFVKWDDRAYKDCSWENTRRLNHICKLKLKNFITKMEEMDEYDEPEEVRREWTIVDRVVARRERRVGGESEKKEEFLIKWETLPYDEITWESGKWVRKNFPRKIEAFEQRHESMPSTSTPLTDVKFKEYKEQPDYIPHKLYPYQLEGLNWLRYSTSQENNVILADEMGLGKTIQSVTFLNSLWHERKCRGPHLVIVPLSTIMNWEREFAFWAPQMNVVTYTGNGNARTAIRDFEFYHREDEIESSDSESSDSESESDSNSDTNNNSRKKRKKKTKAPKKKPTKKKKKSQVEKILKFNVLLTSYEMVRMDSSKLKKIPWESVVIDEGHRLKDSASKGFLSLVTFKANLIRIILTGTPLQNNIKELFNLMAFLEPEKFHVEKQLEEFENLQDKEQVEKLHNLLRPHILRRLKDDVLTQLPTKTELIVLVEMSRLQKQYYKAILTKNYSVLHEGVGKAKKTGLLNILIELRKCCNHPYLFPGAEKEHKSKQEEYEHMIEDSGKLWLLDKMLFKLKNTGHRVLIFSQMTKTLDVLEDYVRYRQWKYERLDGDTSHADRNQGIDQFNMKNSEKFVFLLSTRAGGLGINLHTADTVILYDSDWNPHNDIQALSRAHRIGQQKKVMIYRMVTRGSVEERIVQKAKKKLVLEHIVVRKLKEELNKAELDDILRYGAADLFKEEEPTLEELQKKLEDKKIDCSQCQSYNDYFKLALETKLVTESKSAIRYDDAAIDKLLNRDQESNTSETKQDINFLNPFKVAKVWETAEADHTEKVRDAAFWDKILWDSVEKREKEVEAGLGKGKRVKKKINYQAEEKISDSESSDSDSEEDEKKKNEAGSESEASDWDHAESESSDEESFEQLDLAEVQAEEAELKPKIARRPRAPAPSPAPNASGVPVTIVPQNLPPDLIHQHGSKPSHGSHGPPGFPGNFPFGMMPNILQQGKIPNHPHHPQNGPFPPNLMGNFPNFPPPGAHPMGRIQLPHPGMMPPNSRPPMSPPGKLPGIDQFLTPKDKAMYSALMMRMPNGQPLPNHPPPPPK